MTDALIIIVPIIISLILIAVSFYLYTIFCHPQDSGLGTSLTAKIVVIFGQSLAWGQLLIVLLGLALDGNSKQMETLYDIVYIIIFILTIFVMPLLSSLYEADQQDSKFKQLCSSFIYAFVVSAVWCLAVFVSFIFCSKYVQTGSTQQKRIPIPLYVFLCQALLGWVLLAVNGAIGLVFLPYDLIRAFTRRPKKINKDQAYELKTQLQNRSDELIEQGQKLQIQQLQFKQKSQQLNFFSRKRRQGQIKDLISKFKNGINKLEQDYENFDAQLHLIQQNPAIPYIKLVCGILCIVMTIVWIVQLFGTTIYVDSQPAFSFLDSILFDLDQGDLSFVAAIIYGILVLYMLACLIKGNTIYGIKIPFIMAFHPLEVNKTYLNSLLFNTLMMLLTSLSILEMSIIVFPTYLKNSYMGNLFLFQVIKLPVFGFLYGDRIYTIVFLCMFGLAMLYLAIKKCRQKKQETRRKSIDKSS